MKFILHTRTLFFTMLLACIFSFTYGQDVIPKSINECEFFVIKYQKENNALELAKYLSRLGYLYWEAHNFDKAIEIFQKAIKANEDLGNQNAIKILCSNIGAIYYDHNNFEQSIIFYKKTQRINEKIGKRADLASDYVNIGQSLQGLKKYDESIKNFEQALTLAHEFSDINLMRTCYSSLAENYEKLDNNVKAHEYYELSATLARQMQKEEVKKLESRNKEAEASIAVKENQLKSTLDTLKQVVQISKEQQLAFDLVNKEKQIQELEHKAKETELVTKQRRTYIIMLAIGGFLLLMFLSLLFIIRQFREKKKAFNLLEQSNHQIIEQKKEIEAQRDIADQQRKKVTDSIYYARRIQKAVLPPLTVIEKVIPEHFILFKPRDIVSGDFYWVTEKEGIVIIAVADCTGHGVPGAFMSMLGVAYLNEIVNKIAVNKHIRSFQANEILNQLRENVINSLHQTGQAEETKDGMDIALCIIDIDHKHLQYAGAHNPVYLIRNNNLIHLEADKMPIGIYKTSDVSFRNQEVNLEQGDLIYLFSDGYIDQFGGSQGLKFFSANFKKLLLEIHQCPLLEQKELLAQRLDEWKGNHEQLDDILVIGFKFTDKRNVNTNTIEFFWPDKRILIAEDTDINYFLLVEALKPTKAQVFRVKNGFEAVEFCKAHEIDLLLMDIRMPVMDGTEATQNIRQFNKELPIIAQTAQAEEGDRERLLSIGCNDYISKPIDLRIFLTTINKYIKN